jgi:hypothetical protein
MDKTRVMRVSPKKLWNWKKKFGDKGKAERIHQKLPFEDFPNLLDAFETQPRMFGELDEPDRCSALVSREVSRIDVTRSC